MRIIGIKGKSGAGKTTLSRMIQECDSDKIEIIHLDDVWANFKKDFFKKQVIVKYDNNNNPVVSLKKNNKQRLMNNKIGRFFVSNKEAFINLLVQMELLKLKRREKKAIIIEGDILDLYSVSKKCDVIIEVEAPFDERKDRVIKRSVESIGKREMVLRDKKIHRIKTKRIPQYIIRNSGDIKILRDFAQQIYEKEIEDKQQIISNPWRIDIDSRKDRKRF